MRIDRVDKMLPGENVCTGCGACKNICPVNAIKMCTNFEGFLYPGIQDEKCIHCKRCEHVCPIKKNIENDEYEEYFAVQAKTDEKESTSGGIFVIIAKYVLSQGGIVFGAAFDKNYKVIHKYIAKEEQLYQLQGSKYVQSEIKYTFRQAKNFLDKGKMVLFSGTPCQIAGLRKYLSVTYENLICVDLICHGVPAPKIWKMYLRTFHKNKNIKSIRFRDNKYMKEKVFSIQYGDSKRYVKEYPNDPYIWGFCYDLFLRKSCYNCMFKGVVSYSDLTLGDAWGAENYAKSLYRRKKRTSVVILRGEKGVQIFDQISNNIEYQKVDKSQVIKYNPCIVSSVSCNKERENFFEELKKHCFRYVLKKYYYKGVINK